MLVIDEKFVIESCNEMKKGLNASILKVQGQLFSTPSTYSEELV